MALLKVVGVIIVAVVVAFCTNFVRTSGILKEIVPNRNGYSQCQTLSGVIGPEDAVIDRSTGHVLITSSDRRKVFTSLGSLKLDQTEPGEVYMLDMNNVNPTSSNNFKVVSIANFDQSKGFNPHGIGLFNDNGKRLVFIVNHLKDLSDVVEIFEWTSNNKLVHLETIHSEDMISLNDVYPVGPRSFYATNDHHYPRSFMVMIESTWGLPWSTVVYYDGNTNTSTIAAGGLKYVNGINGDPKKKELYVAETLGRQVSVFSVANNGTLSLEYQIPIDSGVDNIDLDEESNLWIASHPNVLASLNHMKSRTPSPSEVFKVTPSKTGSKVENVYTDSGEQLSAASVAISYDGSLLVGQVFDDGMLYCN